MSEPVMKKSQLKIWFLIPLLVFVGFIIMLFFRLGESTQVTMNESLNRPVPTFSLPLLADMTQTVGNDALPKEPFLINVWGSWCSTCVIEHPFLLQLKKEGIKIFGVNYKDELEDAQTYLKTRDDPFVMSVQDYDGDLAIDLGLTGAPETFIVDAQGNIRQHIVGDINPVNWEQRILPCMNLLAKIDNGKDDKLVSDNEVTQVCQ